jgi:Ca-activated chloride channel family protein
MPRFEWPWVLAALLVLPLLRRRGPRTPALRITRAFDPALLPRSTRQRWATLPGKLRIAALALLICALAGPRLNGRRVREISKTMGIQVVVDCSGSMNETDMYLEGHRSSRIDMVRELSTQFVLGNGNDLKGRMDDTIGVIAFAEHPMTLCPLMLPDSTMGSILRGIRVAQGITAEGTAIGDAIAVAAARFQRAETTAGEGFRSKAIVLLTDGENNSGKYTVAEAAALAKKWGVRIYAVGIRPAPARQVQREDPAMADLLMLAATTGGLARLVSDGSSLQAVYREIDQLERSEHGQARFTGGWELIYALLAGGLLLLMAEIALTQGWLRRVP